jgi:septum formation protein
MNELNGDEAGLVLASSSPRRLSLLRAHGFTVTCSPADVDERVFDHLPIAERVVALARLKVVEGSREAPVPPHWAVGADTLVSIDNVALGKAADRVEARSMLMMLAGRTHIVSTGVCVLNRQTGTTASALSETRVTFAPMNEAEIEGYLDTGEWIGVAGAYRAQERAAFFIERLDGSFSGVVGLPLHEFYAILASSGYPFQFGSKADTVQSGVMAR